MRIASITYSRVFSLGDFQNEKIGCEVELLEGEEPQKAFEEAKKFVEYSSQTFHDKIKRCQEIIANADNYMVKEVKLATEFLDRVNLDFSKQLNS
jgi:hypothetical protein